MAKTVVEFKIQMRPDAHGDTRGRFLAVSLTGWNGLIYGRESVSKYQKNGNGWCLIFANVASLALFILRSMAHSRNVCLFIAAETVEIDDFRAERDCDNRVESRNFLIWKEEFEKKEFKFCKALDPIHYRPLLNSVVLRHCSREIIEFLEINEFQILGKRIFL